MCKESQNWCFFIDIPNDNTLIVRTTDKGLTIFRNRESSNPSFMPSKCFFAISGTNFPKPNGLISGTRKDHISFRIEVHIRNVMIMPVESLEAKVIVIDIPKFDGQIWRAWGEVSTLVIEVDIINGIYIRNRILVCPRRVRSRSPVSNYQIFIVPSSELVASVEYWGWKASAVILDLCPFS